MYEFGNLESSLRTEVRRNAKRVYRYDIMQRNYEQDLFQKKVMQQVKNNKEFKVYEKKKSFDFIITSIRHCVRCHLNIVIKFSHKNTHMFPLLVWTMVDASVLLSFQLLEQPLFAGVQFDHKKERHLSRKHGFKFITFSFCFTFACCFESFTINKGSSMNQHLQTI